MSLRQFQNRDHADRAAIMLFHMRFICIALHGHRHDKHDDSRNIENDRCGDIGLWYLGLSEAKRHVTMPIVLLLTLVRNPLGRHSIAGFVSCCQKSRLGTAFQMEVNFGNPAPISAQLVDIHIVTSAYPMETSVILVSESRAARLLDVASTRFTKLREEGLIQPVAEVGGRRVYALDAVDRLKNTHPLALLQPSKG